MFKYNQLSKLWFRRLIKTGKITLHDMVFQDIEQSITHTYLLLELVQQQSLNADHLALH